MLHVVARQVYHTWTQQEVSSRLELIQQAAAGGAIVAVGCILSAATFALLVAIKRSHQ